MALPPQAPLAPGTRLGSYEIERLLDSGSIAHVYLAKDLRLDRDVAIKLIHEELARNEEWLRSFERAARSVAALNHPNVITIYDVERHGNTLYISMEYVEGETLRAKLDASPLSTRELLTFGTQVADGLAKAHADGIVHGAVKPENVMLSRDGFAKVLGFGESQLSDRSQNASASEWVTGQTPRSSARAANAYTSPEQDGGLPVDFRSDQFFFGMDPLRDGGGTAGFSPREGRSVGPRASIHHRTQPRSSSAARRDRRALSHEGSPGPLRLDTGPCPCAQSGQGFEYQDATGEPNKRPRPIVYEALRRR